jgi:hypothetical protein
MCAFDALIAAPQATLVDFPVLNAHYPGSGSTMSGTLSAAIAAYGFMLTSRATGALSHYRALVASNSWGIFHPSWDFPPGNLGRYCDNPNHPFNVQISAATRAGIDILFAAGNCGAPCADGRCQGRTTGTIMGASAVQEVLTVAGCDSNDVRVGYSSQGPSIAGMYQNKPDITSYTHFLGSEVFGSNSPDSGTSAACPVAAGCVAALRSSTKIPPTSLPTAALYDQIRRSARPASAIPLGWNGDYGFGVIDPVAVATALGLWRRIALTMIESERKRSKLTSMGKDLPFALMTVVLMEDERSLTGVARVLGIKVEEIDPVFGVVPIDPERGTFAIQVRSDKALQPSHIDAEHHRGPWANPAIAPLGPVSK